MATATFENGTDMEFTTTVEELPKQLQQHHITPKTFVHVTVLEENKNNVHSLPQIPYEERKRILDSMPPEFPEDSDEMIKLIQESRMNTTRIPFSDHA